MRPKGDFRRRAAVTFCPSGSEVPLWWGAFGDVSVVDDFRYRSIFPVGVCSSPGGVKSRRKDEVNFYLTTLDASKITCFLFAAEQGVCSLGRSSIVVE